MFGFGQQAVVAHAISHGVDWHESQDQDNNADTLSACAQCIAFANLGSAAPSTEFVFGAAPYTPPAQDVTHAIIGVSSTPQQRARAPPPTLA